MSTVVFFGDRAGVAVDALPDGERLPIDADQLEAATGWTLKPEGLCREEACVPLPRDGSWQDEAGRVDVAAFARRAGRPVVRDPELSVWAFGDPVQTRRDAALDVRAPDFTLPDLEGDLHSLSDYRGKKIFLLAWGSY